MAFNGREAGTCSTRADGPSLLIIGGRGTLGQAVQHVCRQRGLPTISFSRAELDLCDPARIAAVFHRFEPWAVFNAAGDVNVDQAETDPHPCWRDNVTGPVNLAAACRWHGLPMVMFSSDLVFDGSQKRPYTERDSPAPLNVYGTAKAEAERRVLDLFPEALVVRTAAFFGPWDDHNFATTVLRRIAIGRTYAAIDDLTVSPTYLPHLVHAVLDLLIDGERGVWHLANHGAISWYAFGRAIARRAGYAEELVIASRGGVGQAAKRPAYSALSSERGQLLPTLEVAIDGYSADVAGRLAQEATTCG
jgi:dTDP-4-dehydrorhamnose reductase